MSTVIDRLAMKAMGVLESVQPVIQARFAAPVPAALDASAEPEQRVRTERTPESVPPQIAAKRIEREPVTPNSTAMMRPRDEQKKPPVTAQHPQGSQQVRPVSAAVGQQSLSSAMSREISPETASRALPTNSSVALPTQAIARGREYRDEEQSAHPLRRDVSPSLTSAQDERMASNRVQRQIRDEPAQQQQQETDIRITIGTIEMRAPRTENRPATPAFRPRVSLDDFLNRKPEGQA